MPFSGKMSSCFRLSFISLKSIFFNDHAASSSRIPECFDLEKAKGASAILVVEQLVSGSATIAVTAWSQLHGSKLSNNTFT
jgi:hypothetical protein